MTISLPNSQEVARLAQAVRPLQCALESMEKDGERLNSLPVLTGVIEDVVLAAHDVIMLHAPQGTFNPDAAGRFLAYVADQVEKVQAAGDRAIGSDAGEQFAGRSISS